jgi:hypothetical protein
MVYSDLLDMRIAQFNFILAVRPKEADSETAIF